MPEKPAAETLAGHQGPRSESRGLPPSEVGDQTAHEWRNDQWSTTHESLNPEDQLLWKMTKRVMRVPTPSPTLFTPGDSLSQTLRKLKPSPTVWRLSLTGHRSFGPGRH